jgi:hypothetical protein
VTDTDQGPRPRTKVFAIGIGATVGVALFGAWWWFRAEQVPPLPRAAKDSIATRHDLTESRSSAQEPSAPKRERSAPPARGRKPAWREPPRFVKSPASPPEPSVPQNGYELAKDNPKALDAISGAAHGSNVTEAEFRAGTQCVRDLAKRNPELVDANTVRGVYVVTVSFKAEEGRVIDIEGRGKEDREMFDCLRKTRTWLSGEPFPAPGAPDGTTKIEWPYRVAVKARPAAPPPAM